MSVPQRDPVRGDWHAFVQATVNGHAKRRHIRGRTRAAVAEAAEKVRAELRTGTLPGGGRVTVHQWLESWIAARESAGKVRPRTIIGYRADAKHINRVIGGVRLDKLTPELVEGLYADLKERGHVAGGILHVRRTLSACLNTAVARKRISENPVRLAEAPPDVAPEVEPLTTVEVQQVLAAAARARNGVRWALALATGLRQGEVLGLQWEDIDWGAKTLAVRRSLARKMWKHGCSQDERCGKKPQHCPAGLPGGLITGDLKTRAGRRSVVMPEPLMNLLTAHRRAQTAERLRAGELWQPGPRGGWLFASQVGTPVDPRNDGRQWKRLLDGAGFVRAVRIHDLRHTAATTALVAGTDSLVLQGIFGWSSPVLVARYAHVVDEAKRQAADRMGSALWPEKGATG